MSRGSRRRLVPVAFRDLTRWPTSDESMFADDQRDKYARRREAVEMYVAGEPYADIRSRTRMCSEEVRRLVRRCVLADGQGSILGFRALTPRIRILPYTRRKEVTHVPGGGSAGCAGALQQLFARMPGAAELVETLLFKYQSKNIIHESCISYKTLHAKLKKYLREQGLTDHDWPFNTKNAGYKAVREYCVRLRDQSPERWIRARAGVEASRRGNVGRGYTTLIPVLRPYTHVQLDFHKVDAASVIILKNHYGTELEIPLSRWFWGTLLDQYSTACLGTCAALEINPSGDSVLEIIESALRPQEPAGSGKVDGSLDDECVLPNQVFPELAFHGFTALRVDNAWGNAATEVVNNIIDVVGCAVNFGPVRAWWVRPHIERFFGGLTRNGPQRLPSTYGSGPSDPRREKPIEQAIKLRIRLSEIITLLRKGTREHNYAATEGKEFSKPIEILKTALEKPASGFLPQPLPRDVRDHPRLLMHVEECTVRGDMKKHVRPYIRVDRCRYTSEALANAYRLLGKVLVVYVDRRDVRNTWASVKDTGESLGRLVPQRRWALHAVSVRERKLINRSGLAQRYSQDRDDAVQDWTRQKKAEVFERRQAKRGQKKLKSSKDALLLAGMADRHDETPKPKSTHTVVAPASPARSDPFGINRLPTIRATVRR